MAADAAQLKRRVRREDRIAFYHVDSLLREEHLKGTTCTPIAVACGVGSPKRGQSPAASGRCRRNGALKRSSANDWLERLQVALTLKAVLQIVGFLRCWHHRRLPLGQFLPVVHVFTQATEHPTHSIEQEHIHRGKELVSYST
jgi:hypothetical protein